jgi:putative PIN family toxin of toxin-antitoxin system
MKKVKLVLDTNILLVCLPEFSLWHWIIKAMLNNQFTLLLSNDIVLEYDEKLLERYPVAYTKDLLDLFLKLDNIQLVEPAYKWNLISTDPDDNKFVDCAVAGNADCIVSNDRHFQGLKQVSFPRIQVLTLSEFEEQFKEKLEL